MKNVDFVRENNICVSCGICKTVCPKQCISYKKVDNQYVPIIDEEKCINCGICYSICPSININNKYKEINNEVKEDFLIGDYKLIANAYSSDNELRKNGTSGGVTITIIKKLLELGLYEKAFLLDTFNYSEFVLTKEYTEIKKRNVVQKSRYISVSHENLIKEMLKNKNSKIIIVATSCAVHGIINVINKYKLDRKNYFIIGLFCDKVLRYSILDYFKDVSKQEVEELYFRTKEKEGWPGNVKIVNKQGEEKFYPAQERMLVKDYFQLERCMYCVDKLNIESDISVGDNYTGKNSDILGSNTIIIRSDEANKVMKLLEKDIVIEKINKQDLIISQKLKEKLKNLKFAKEKSKIANIDLYPNYIDDKIQKEIIKEYNEKIRKIELGKEYYKNNKKIFKIIKTKKLKNKIKRITKKIINK